MSDSPGRTLDRLFDQLRGQRPPVPFAPAEAVRRRGRQRAHRQAVSVGVAVFVVAGLGAGGLATAVGQPEPAPPTAAPALSASPAPSAPARTVVPPEWLLSADDLGPGEWAPPGSDPFELENGPWIWRNRCVVEGTYEEAVTEFPSLQRRRDIELVVWEDTALAGSRLRVKETVELFDPGVAAANLADVAAAVAACDESPGEELLWTVIDGDLAGDESLLVQEAWVDPTDGTEFPREYYAVVRVADAVATVMTTDEDLAREVALRAADRLS